MRFILLVCVDVRKREEKERNKEECVYGARKKEMKNKILIIVIMMK